MMSLPHARIPASASWPTAAPSRTIMLDRPSTPVHTPLGVSMSPPTPAPSPIPSARLATRMPTPDEPVVELGTEELALIRQVRDAFQHFDAQSRNRFLAEILECCPVETLVHVSSLIAPRIKRDFLKDLPTEIALHILSFIHDPQALARASSVSKFWRSLLSDEFMWKNMCKRHRFCSEDASVGLCTSPRSRNSRRLGLLDAVGDGDGDIYSPRSYNAVDNRSLTARLAAFDLDPSTSPTFSPLSPLPRSQRLSHTSREAPKIPFSYRQHFKSSYVTEHNWRRTGRVLRSHTSPDDGVVTSVAIDNEWIVVGLANRRIHVFSAETGDLTRTLNGHGLGVWCLNLVSKGGKPIAPPAPGSSSRSASTTLVKSARPLPVFGLGLSVGNDPSPPMSPTMPSERSSTTLPEGLYQSDPCNSSLGWGQEGALVVSGACDRDVRVWDVRSGYCLHLLKGHSSTVRCVKVLDGRPVAVSGARDGSIRVWDIQKGICLRVLEGHEGSVRALDVAGNVAVSGSYDNTARLWNVDTGECMRTFRGHVHQIYAVAFDGVRLATGSLDSTVRLWDAESGDCLALLQGHTSLVGHLQLLDGVLVTGGSDGRVIVFSLDDFQTLQRICAHDNSVTCMQFDDRFVVTGGNDGHVKLFERATGNLVRELTEPCDAVWKVMFRRDKCVIMCKRAGKTVIEILSFGPTPEQL